MKQVQEFYWPDHDNEHPVILNLAKDIQRVLHYVKNWDVCIQAGGNVGVWAKRLSPLFKAVYTWEPDPENFNCLVKNVPEANVIKFNCCLGLERGMVRVGSPNKAHDKNCGAYQVLGEGITPVMRIDDLSLPACDLLYLDIEGYELFAVQGAFKTIKKYHPVISIEQKKLPLNYGLHPEAAAEYLIKTFGYEVVERPHRDIVLV